MQASISVLNSTKVGKKTKQKTYDLFGFGVLDNEC